MSANDLLIYIGDIDDKYITETAPNYDEYSEIAITAKRPKRIIQTIMQFAACIVLIAAAIVFVDLHQSDTILPPVTDVSSWNVFTEKTSDFTQTTTVSKPINIKTLSIVAADCNISIVESGTDSIKYYFDKDLFSVTKKTSDDTTIISAAIKPDAVTDFDDKIKIAIPSDMFTAISADIKRSGLSLPSMNIDINIVSDNGAVSFSPPKNYDKAFTADLKNSSGSLLFDKAATDFTVTINTEQSAVSLPENWLKFSPKTEYIYTSGGGDAEFDITLDGSSFAVGQ